MEFEQVVVALGVDATDKPSGRISENFTPVNFMVFGLLSVKVKVLVPFVTTGFGEKDLVKVGCSGTPQPVTTTLSK